MISVAYLLRHLCGKQYWAVVRMAMDDKIFTSEARRIYHELEKLHAVSAEDVTLDALAASLESTYATRRHISTEIETVLTEMRTIEFSNDKEVVIDGILSFVQRRGLWEAAKRIVEQIDNPDLDLNSIQSRMEILLRAKNYSTDGPPQLYDIPIKGRDGIRSLFLGDDIDNALHGGIGNGEIYLLLAPPKRGKTSVLCHVGCNAARSGDGVLHITLEIAGHKVAGRYFSSILENFVQSIDDTKRKWAWGKITESGGDVRVQSWRPQQAGADDISMMIRRLRSEGHKVDMVVVDYMALMRPSVRHKEKRFDYGLVCQELRGLAIEENVKCMTAWQINRAGADAPNITTAMVQECFEVVNHADALIALNQTESEAARNIMRVKLLEGRESTKRPETPMYFDKDQMILRPLHVNRLKEEATQQVVTQQAAVCGN